MDKREQRLAIELADAADHLLDWLPVCDKTSSGYSRQKKLRDTVAVIRREIEFIREEDKAKRAILSETLRVMKEVDFARLNAAINPDWKHCAGEGCTPDYPCSYCDNLARIDPWAYHVEHYGDR